MISKLMIALGMVQAAMFPIAENSEEHELLNEIDDNPFPKLIEEKNELPMPANTPQINQIGNNNDDEATNYHKNSSRSSSLSSSQSGVTGTNPVILDNLQSALESVRNPPRVFFYSPLDRRLVEEAFATHCAHFIHVTNSHELNGEQVIRLIDRVHSMAASEDAFVAVRVIKSLSKFKAQMELWVKYALEEEDEEDRRVTELRNACEAIELGNRKEFKFGKLYDISLYMYIHCDDIILLDHQHQ